MTDKDMCVELKKKFKKPFVDITTVEGYNAFCVEYGKRIYPFIRQKDLARARSQEKMFTKVVV